MILPQFPGHFAKLPFSLHRAFSVIREVKEELSLDLISSSIHFAGVFSAEADGKPDGTEIKMACYFSEYSGEIKLDSEIKMIKWLSHDEKDQTSVVTQIIMDFLKSNHSL